MTTLVIQTLSSPLVQEIRVAGEERSHIGAIIPYLYIHNASGSVVFSLKNSSGTVFSRTFSVTDIKNALNTADDYAHVFYPVIPESPLKLEKGDYTLELEAGAGYTASGSSFIGWIQQHEDVQNEMDYIPLGDAQNSLAFRVKVLKEGIL